MSLHHHTPSLTVIDPRGLNVRNIAYQRRTAQEPPQACITRQVFDPRGFLQQQWDPRLFALQQSDPEVQPNLQHRHSLSGQVLCSHSVDAGRQVRWCGTAGQLLEQWDGRGGHQRFEYDLLLRPVAVFERAAGEAAERCVERMTYAGMTAVDAAHNRCGRLIRHDDPAGTLFHEGYGIQGEVTRQTRRLRAVATDRDWPLPMGERDAQLQAEAFTTTWQYDALGQVLEQIDARGNRQRSRYGVDGLLSDMSIVFKSGVRKALLGQRTFNASAQVTCEQAGNGVVSVAQYSPRDGRLMRLTARHKDTPDVPLQDLAYRYDRVGNVLRIHDAAQPTRWASNGQVEAVSTFEYDSLSQLITARGRENARQGGTAALPGRVTFGATDDTLWRQYTRHYTYDQAGNLSQMRHAPATGSGYTQRMRIGARSNHSVIEQTGAVAPGLGAGFDPGGNQQTLGPGQAMSWNVRNQLVRVAQVVRDNGEHDDETYVYDGAGQRVLKRRVAHTATLAHTHEVLYLPGLHLHRHGATGEWLNVLVAEAGRNTVRGLQWEQGRPREMSDEQLRFGLSDHLGSQALELDEHAGLLSQESYYPFGATAWWAAKSAVEASYKTLRYSGKERDASGLYYYGFRYYAPWLMRWISADPAGDADGLNLYAMVGNNPVSFVDAGGLQRTPVLEVLVLIVLLTLVGYGVGAPMQREAAGAFIGFFGGILGLGLVGHGEYQRQRAVFVVTEARQQQARDIGRKSAEHLGGMRNLTAPEIDGLADFFMEQRLGAPDTQHLAYGITPAARGGYYAYIGPIEHRAEADAAAKSERNPRFTLSRLGFVGIEVRASSRKTASTPLPTGGLTQDEVAPVTKASGAPHKGIAEGGPVAPPAMPGLSSGRAPHRPVIDVDDILDDLRGPGGPIIRRVLGGLEAGTIPFARGHAFHQAANTRSFDLPGYQGHTGRGAYRLLVQHVSGFNYRAVRVMDPHRR